MKFKNRKAFTLIELLIVIAIIAVLATVVILSLNPAELLRQARDSNRISDMATYKSAIALYLADVSSPAIGTAATCYISVATTTIWAPATSTHTFTAGTCAQWMASATSVVGSSTRGIGTSGGVVSGWLPIAFAQISSGAPIGLEPVDPTNSAGTSGCSVSALSSCGLLYSYIMSGTNYKLGAQMESAKYTNGGGGDVETNDGGISVYMYEQGTSLSL